MDIIVKGEAQREFEPEKIEINITFNKKELNYDDALLKGTKSVEDFIDKVLIPLGMKKEDLKTSRFNVREVSRYDYETKKNIFEGYAYNQNSYIKFDYDIKKMTQFIELTSKIENMPNYVMSYDVKDEDLCKNIVIGDAYNKAKIKAEAIAVAAGMKLLECIRTDFKPFGEQIVSNSSYGSGDIRKKSFDMNEEASVERSIAQTIEKTFTPEKVKISEELYCLWRAE